MPEREWFDPTPEDQNVVLIDATVVRRAERWIASCQACTPDLAEIPLDWVLDQMTGSDAWVTDYMLAEPARCPRCSGAIREKTLVMLRDDGFDQNDVAEPKPAESVKP
jgi:hypothetical protein